MKWRPYSSVTLPASGFVEPCIPSVAKRVPVGSDWVYELKHDGYRLLVRRQDEKVRIYSRRGADFTHRFPRIVDAARRLKALGAARRRRLVYNGGGMLDFGLLHSKLNDTAVSLVAFDLLEIDG